MLFRLLPVLIGLGVAVYMVVVMLDNVEHYRPLFAQLDFSDLGVVTLVACYGMRVL